MNAQVQRVLWIDEGVARLRLSALPDKIAEAALGPAEGTDDDLFERGFKLPAQRDNASKLISAAIEEGKLQPVSYDSGLPLAKPERWRHDHDAAVTVQELVALLASGWLCVRIRPAHGSPVEPDAAATAMPDRQDLDEPDAAVSAATDPQAPAAAQAAQERADQRGAEALERYKAYRGEVTPGDLEYLIELAWAGFCAEPGPTPEAFNTLEKFKALPWDYDSLEAWAKKGELAARQGGQPDGAPALERELAKRAAQAAEAPSSTDVGPEQTETHQPAEPAAEGRALVHLLQRRSKHRHYWLQVLEHHLPRWDRDAGGPITDKKEAIRLLAGLGNPRIGEADYGTNLRWKTENGGWKIVKGKTVINMVGKIRTELREISGEPSQGGAPK